MRPAVILTSGTRGDVQPLLALGLALRDAGLPVRFVTHARFGALVEAAGLPFAELDGDLSELLEAERSALVLGPRLRESAAATLRYLRTARPRYAAMLASAWERCRDARLVIGSLPTDACGGQIAEALGVPYVRALLQPLGATRAFASPLLPSARSLGPLNRLSHRLTELTLWLPWRAELARWRVATLGLGPPPPGGPLAAAERRGLLALYGVSPLVVPRPRDWPAWRRMCGYWPLARPAGWRPDPALVRFLESGPPPVYLGLGSMGAHRPGMASLAVRALRQAGQRGLLALDEPIPAELAGPDMLAVGPAWHDWLLPQVAAVAHHGGAGTTAAALRAGAPMIAMPVGVDQHFWGARVAALGCGPPPIAARVLTPALLAAQIDAALRPAARARAAALGAALRAEQGLAAAVTAVSAL